MRSASLAYLLFFAPAVAAQGLVSPAHFAAAEAPSSNRFPFGNAPSAPFRYLQVHDDLQGSPRAIRGMSFRRVGSTCGVPACTMPFPAYSVTLDAWCSTATTTSATVSTTFDTNHGTDKAQVIVNKAFNFPATAHGPVPQPFAYVIAYDVPYLFLGQGPFCWEVQLTGGTNTVRLFLNAATTTGPNPALANSTFGDGCRVSTRTSPLTALGTSQMNWAASSGSLVVNGAQAPASAPVLTLLGFRDTSFGGIPLPFLIPGTGTAPSGPCTLYTDLALVAGAVADAAGSSTTTIPVPATVDLHGARTFEQNLVVDPAANSPGLVLSNAVNHNWVAPYLVMPVGMIWLERSLGPTGNSGAGYGLVTRFTL